MAGFVSTFIDHSWTRSSRSVGLIRMRDTRAQLFPRFRASVVNTAASWRLCLAAEVCPTETRWRAGQLTAAFSISVLVQLAQMPPQESRCDFTPMF